MKIDINLIKQQILDGPTDVNECMQKLAYKMISSGTYATVWRKGQTVIRIADRSTRATESWYKFVEANPSQYYVRVKDYFYTQKCQKNSKNVMVMLFSILENLIPLSRNEEYALFERLEKGSKDKDSFEYAYKQCENACRNLPFKMDVLDFNMYGIVENVMRRKNDTFVITDPWR